jgi:SWI/SNF-related matrix-associated actin-dependent regulator of chromatin subfamily A3
VNNVQGVKVGHLPRTVAQFLAPPMDQGVLQIEGLVPSGTGNAYKMPVWLALWAEPQHAAAVQQAVRHAGLSLGAAPGARGGGGGGGGGGGASGSAAPAAPSPRKPPAHELAAAVERVFASIELGGPRAWCEPHHSVATTLFTHQKEALAWMITRENSNALPPFWEAQPGRGGGAPQYVHALTNFTAPARPAPMRGGLLADDMGLGKTLQTIALIATNRPGAAHPQMLAAPPEEEEEEQEQEAAGGSGQGSGRPAKKPKKEAAEAAAAAAAAEPPPSPPAAGGPRGTLIVCPLSVLPGWEMQLEEHVAPGALRCLTYHGPARERSAATLSSQDVVLTTYATLAAEVGAKNGATRVHWLRVVADEAHTVKNPATQAAKALAALRADRRWAITGASGAPLRTRSLPPPPPGAAGGGPMRALSCRLAEPPPFPLPPPPPPPFCRHAHHERPQGLWRPALLPAPGPAGRRLALPPHHRAPLQAGRGRRGAAAAGPGGQPGPAPHQGAAPRGARAGGAAAACRGGGAGRIGRGGAGKV